MGINFPNTPTVGTLYPSPPVVGQPVYRWDGEKWSVQSLLAKQPIYADGSVPMTAQLTLVAPPVAATDAAAKSYVDTGVAAATAGASSELASKAVRYDAAQVLTAAQQVQARQNIYAAPLDALGFSGLQINGAMEVYQNGVFGTNYALANSTPSNLFDLWYASRNSASGIFTHAGFNVGGPPGLPHCFSMIATTAMGAPAAADYAMFSTYIEGTRWRRLGFGGANAQPVAICFWAASTVAGTAYVRLTNWAANRSCVVPFTMAGGGGWEYKTVFIPGDVAGVWVVDNTGAVTVSFVFACGSNAIAPAANAWQAGNYFAAAGVTNFFAANNNNVYIAGVVILPGVEAPRQERQPFVLRPYDIELPLCKRYFQKLTFADNDVVNFYGYNVGTATPAYQAPFGTEMRIAPVMAIAGAFT
jgi:hypothetical protein